MGDVDERLTCANGNITSYVEVLLNKWLLDFFDQNVYPAVTIFCVSNYHVQIIYALAHLLMPSTDKEFQQRVLKRDKGLLLSAEIYAESVMQCHTKFNHLFHHYYTQNPVQCGYATKLTDTNAS
jgi:hypothetical protein